VGPSKKPKKRHAPARVEPASAQRAALLFKAFRPSRAQLERAAHHNYAAKAIRSTDEGAARLDFNGMANPRFA
jgi:hypothetical protein